MRRSVNYSRYFEIRSEKLQDEFEETRFGNCVQFAMEKPDEARGKQGNVGRGRRLRYSIDDVEFRNFQKLLGNVIILSQYYIVVVFDWDQSKPLGPLMPSQSSAILDLCQLLFVCAVA